MENASDADQIRFEHSVEHEVPRRADRASLSAGAALAAAQVVNTRVVRQLRRHAATRPRRIGREFDEAVAISRS